MGCQKWLCLCALFFSLIFEGLGGVRDFNIDQLIGYESQLHAYLMNSKFKVSFPHCIGAKNKSQ